MKNSNKNKQQGITQKWSDSRSKFQPKKVWKSSVELRWEKILSDPIEARECLQKVLDEDMFELHNADSVSDLTDDQVFSAIKGIRTHIEDLELEERKEMPQ